MNLAHPETLNIVAAFSKDVQSHRGVVAFCMTSLLIKRPQLAGVIGSSPEDFANILIDQIIALAQDNSETVAESFVQGLAAVPGETHQAIEQALLTSLRIGLGTYARPVLLNAWSAAYWLLLERYGIAR